MARTELEAPKLSGIGEPDFTDVTDVRIRTTANGFYCHITVRYVDAAGDAAPMQGDEEFFVTWSQATYPAQGQITAKIRAHLRTARVDGGLGLIDAP